MASLGLTSQLVFAAVGPFVTSLWLAGDWGLTTAIFLIGQYLIRLPIYAQESNMGWGVFTDLTTFWEYTMLGFLIIGSAGAGTLARFFIRIPNVVNIRKIFYTKGDRQQSKFLVPNNGTVFLMLVFALVAIAGTLVLHDVLLAVIDQPFYAVFITPAAIAAAYIIVYFVMTIAYNNAEGTALWGYSKTVSEYERSEEIPGPEFRVMRRTLLTVAIHHILPTVIIDIAIVMIKDFTTVFIVAAIVVVAMVAIDLVLYFFYFRNLDDFAPFHNNWVVDLKAMIILPKAEEEEEEDALSNGSNFNANFASPLRTYGKKRKSALFSMDTVRV